MAEPAEPTETGTAASPGWTRNGRVGPCRVCRSAKVIAAAGRCGSCDTWHRWHRSNGYQTVTATLVLVGDVIRDAAGTAHRVERVERLPDEVRPRVRLLVTAVGPPFRLRQLTLEADDFAVTVPPAGVKRVPQADVLRRDV